MRIHARDWHTNRETLHHYTTSTVPLQIYNINQRLCYNIYSTEMQTSLATISMFQLQAEHRHTAGRFAV